MLAFYNTIGGRRFIDHTVPDLIRQLEKVHVAINRLADILGGARPEPVAQVEGDDKEGG